MECFGIGNLEFKDVSVSSACLYVGVCQGGISYEIWLVCQLESLSDWASRASSRERHLIGVYVRDTWWILNISNKEKVGRDWLITSSYVKVHSLKTRQILYVGASEVLVGVGRSGRVKSSLIADIHEGIVLDIHVKLEGHNDLDLCACLDAIGNLN